ncbi:MAG: FTR1 family protein [Rhodoblastus sp.]|nr:MAG: FTR1 family protein [Rhodoblastus sp.]
MSLLSSALQSGSILLREGLEAMLIIAILAGVLAKSGQNARVRHLYWGAGAAVVASLGMAFVFAYAFNGAHSDLLEAAVMAVAAGLMFYMSGWLYLKQDPKALAAHLKQGADRAILAGAGFSFSSLAFLAVFREGAETMLFLQALAKTEGGWNLGLALGVVAAFVLLVVAYAAMRRATLKLPLRPVFLITSAFLFVMGLRFVGAAIQELQEQQIVGFDEAPFGRALESLGFNPTWEAVLPQLAVIALAALGAAALRMRAAPATA